MLNILKSRVAENKIALQKAWLDTRSLSQWQPREKENEMVNIDESDVEIYVLDVERTISSTFVISTTTRFRKLG